MYTNIEILMPRKANIIFIKKYNTITLNYKYRDINAYNYLQSILLV